jgi:hypothetical protein
VRHQRCGGREEIVAHLVDHVWGERRVRRQPVSQRPQVVVDRGHGGRVRFHGVRHLLTIPGSF